MVVRRIEASTILGRGATGSLLTNKRIERTAQGRLLK